MSRANMQEGRGLPESVTISQRVIPYIRSLGYLYIDTEVRIPTGSRTTTADAVVYLDREKATPYIVVETKQSLSADLTLLDPAVQQAFAIAVALGEQVRYLLITDGAKNYWFERSAEGRSLVQLSLPPELTQRRYEPMLFELPLTPVTDPEQFSQLIESVISVFVQDGLTLGLRTAIELNRILIAKLHDEQTTEHGIPYRFSWRGEPVEVVAEKIKQLYEEAVAQLGGISTEQTIWSMSAQALVTVVQILEPFALTSVSASIRGRFFWTVFSKLLSGREAQYASPAALAEFLVQLVDPVSGESVIDPACGTGLFLVEAFQSIESQLSTAARSAADLVESRLASRQRIIGIEINAEVAELAATNLTLNNLPPRIIKANALDARSLKRAGIELGAFDVVLLDPPIGTAPKDSPYLDDFELSHIGGRTSLEVLFIEQALKLLRPGGRAAIIVPDSVLSSPSYLQVRAWLLDNALLRAVISLPPEAFAPLGHSGKASVILLRNERSRLGSGDPILVADIQAVGYDRFGKPTRENDLARLSEAVRFFEKSRQIEVREKGLRVWQFSPSRLSADRLDVSWLDPDGQQFATAITRGAYPVVQLHEVASIISGRNFKQYVEPGVETAALIQAGAVRDLEIDLSSSPHLRFEDFQQAARAQIEVGDVLVTTTGTYLGRAAVVDSLPGRAVASGAVTILRPRSGNEVDPFFLAAVMSSEIGKEQVARLQAAATAQPYIRRSDLGEILIPLPPLAKQQDLARRVQEMLKEARALARHAETIESSAKRLILSELLEVSDAQ